MTVAPAAAAPLPSSAPSSTRPLAPTNWSVLDQALIETVLFAPPTVETPVPAAAPVVPTASVAPIAAVASAVPLLPDAALYAGLGTPPPAPVPLDHVYQTPQQQASGAAMFLAAGAKLADAFDLPTASIEPSQATTDAPKKPKRKRKYTDSTRAKHREVQRRFIVRKKEKLSQDKQLAVLLEKQLALLRLHAETAALESERSGLLQECIANNIQLDDEHMKVFLIEEMDVIASCYTPLLPNEWREIVAQTLRYIDGFCPDEAFLDDGTNVVGWQHQSRVENATLSFRVAKAFDAVTPAMLFERTWYTIASIDAYSEIFNSGILIKTKLLQPINESTAILYRVLYHPLTMETTRSVELVCRLKRGDGYLFFIQGLQGLSVQSFVGSPESWMRGVVWCHVTPSDSGGGCKIHWTGCVGSSVESLEHWRQEIVFLVVRYESLLIAPMLSAASDVSSGIGPDGGHLGSSEKTQGSTNANDVAGTHSGSGGGGSVPPSIDLFSPMALPDLGNVNMGAMAAAMGFGDFGGGLKMDAVASALGLAGGGSGSGAGVVTMESVTAALAAKGITLPDSVGNLLASAMASFGGGGQQQHQHHLASEGPSAQTRSQDEQEAEEEEEEEEEEEDGESEDQDEDEAEQQAEESAVI